MNGSQQSLEKAEGELQDVIDAGNAGEETLLGFLRANKPDWAQDIGRLVSEKTLLRSDLAPVLTGGIDLFGVSIDLEQLDATIAPTTTLSATQTVSETAAPMLAPVAPQATPPSLPTPASHR